jgi:hypothetical protein
MKDVPDYDEFVTCQRPDCLHEEAQPVTGLHGMLGGGMGPYTVCSKCGDLLTKSQDTELSESHKPVEIKDAPESPEVSSTPELDK